MECSRSLIILFVTMVATDEITNYLDNDEIYNYLKDVNDNYQNVSHLYSIGTSNLGQELWVLMLSLAPANEIGIPNIKIIGNIHGNEPIGRELIIFFIKKLVKGYAEGDEDIIHLLKTTKIHFLPSANPDGFSEAIEGECNLGPGRKNVNGIDLNRNFLPVFSWSGDDFIQREKETTAIVQWMTQIHFVLSISIHSGSLVVVYPYDESKESDVISGESLTDDNDIFKHLALKYATNTKGAIYEICPVENGGRHFENGIINGAAWYSARGTMGDYNYHYHGCMELTVEVSCCKYPHPSKLHNILDNHLEAMMAFVGEVHQGIKGIVTCGGFRDVSYIQVLGRNMTIQTTDNGEYWRILLPGRYFLQVESASCITEIVLVEIPQRKLYQKPESIILNINLKKVWDKDIINDEIYLETVDAEENDVTVQDLYFTVNTTESGNINGTVIRGQMTPQMESSISFSIIHLPSSFLLNLFLYFSIFHIM